MDEPKIITYQLHLEDFTFLGNPNIIDQNSDFGAIWDGFFQKGGYDAVQNRFISQTSIPIISADHHIVPAPYGAQNLLKYSFHTIAPCCYVSAFSVAQAAPS